MDKILKNNRKMDVEKDKDEHFWVIYINIYNN